MDKGLDPALQWAVLVFCLGLAFYAGVLSTRVANLELWRKEFMDDFHSEMGDLKAMIRGES